MTRQTSRSPFEPPRERGTGRAFALAVVMHVLLAYLLYHGIHWQNSTPAGAEAELWTEVPDTSQPRPAPPPPPVAPAPPVRDEQADIALQEQKRREQEALKAQQLAEQQREKLAQQQAEAKRQQELAAQQAADLAAQKAAKLKQQQQQAAAEKLRRQQQQQQQQKLAEQKQQQEQQEQARQQADAQKKADAAKAAKAAQAKADAAKKLAQERRARLAQMQGLAGNADSTGNGLAKSGTGSGAGGTAASAGYAEKVQRRVRPNIHWAGDTQGLETVVAVRCAPTGTLLSATIIRSSSNPQWDDAALRAVQASDPMPLDTNGKTPSAFTITLRPGG